MGDKAVLAMMEREGSMRMVRSFVMLVGRHWGIKGGSGHWSLRKQDQLINSKLKQGNKIIRAVVVNCDRILWGTGCALMNEKNYVAAIFIGRQSGLWLANDVNNSSAIEPLLMYFSSVSWFEILSSSCMSPPAWEKETESKRKELLEYFHSCMSFKLPSTHTFLGQISQLVWMAIPAIDFWNYWAKQTNRHM